MAIFHCEVKCIGRSNGRTASGSAAYRSGEKVKDNAGDIHDYTKKQGILFKEIILPVDAPYWASDRATLWNNVDKAETRKNSTVAREYEIALPAELNQDEQAKLSKVFAKYLVNEYGIAADISIHAPRKDSNNYHAHILTSTRILEADGFGAKTRVLDSAKTGSIEIKKIRAVWEDLANQALERNGIDERVSCESLKAQGIDREPQVHLGVAAAAMERRGIRTERSDHNRQIREREAAAKAVVPVEAKLEQAAPMGATLPLPQTSASAVKEVERQPASSTSSVDGPVAVLEGTEAPKVEELEKHPSRTMPNAPAPKREGYIMAPITVAALQTQPKEAEAVNPKIAALPDGVLDMQFGMIEAQLQRRVGGVFRVKLDNYINGMAENIQKQQLQQVEVMNVAILEMRVHAENEPQKPVIALGKKKREWEERHSIWKAEHEPLEQRASDLFVKAGGSPERPSDVAEIERRGTAEYARQEAQNYLDKTAEGRKIKSKLQVEAAQQVEKDEPEGVQLFRDLQKEVKRRAVIKAERYAMEKEQRHQRGMRGMGR